MSPAKTAIWASARAVATEEVVGRATEVEAPGVEAPGVGDPGVGDPGGVLCCSVDMGRVS
ncbi:hypothetical protein GCM10010467_20620 [Actinocorallia glomerata]|uniref:Uncharacterized protein n=2 Tax=Actinomycetes TaxID=1760 RepID=A0ABP6M199_9MICC